MRLTLIRHASTDFSDARRYTGHNDVPINARGIEQAERLRASMAQSQPIPSTVYCSDLRRCHHTASIVFPHAVLRPDRRLRELDFGSFEGNTHDDNMAAFPHEYADWLATGGVSAPPGGEALGDFGARVWSWLRDLGDDPAYAVTHGGVIRFLLIELGHATMHTVPAIDPCSVFQFDVPTHLQPDAQ